jgi:hypothetical protein
MAWHAIALSLVRFLFLPLPLPLPRPAYRRIVFAIDLLPID